MRTLEQKASAEAQDWRTRAICAHFIAAGSEDPVEHLSALKIGLKALRATSVATRMQTEFATPWTFMQSLKVLL